MSELIDKNQLKVDLVTFANGKHGKCLSINDVMQLIENLKTVEIIKCRECKYWVNNGVLILGKCTHPQVNQKKNKRSPINYCGYAEPSEEV